MHAAHIHCWDPVAFKLVWLPDSCLSYPSCIRNTFCWGSCPQLLRYCRYSPVPVEGTRGRSSDSLRRAPSDPDPSPRPPQVSPQTFTLTKIRRNLVRLVQISDLMGKLVARSTQQPDRVNTKTCRWLRAHARVCTLTFGSAWAGAMSEYRQRHACASCSTSALVLFFFLHNGGIRRADLSECRCVPSGAGRRRAYS